MRTYFDDPDLEVRPAGPAERLSRQSILTELTSWRCGSTLGLFRQRLELQSARPGVPSRLSVVIKLKADPRHLLDVVTAAAGMCDERVGSAFARWRDRLGFGGLREIALYRQTDERWRRLTPTCYGAAWDQQRRGGAIVMEDLAGTWMDPSGGTDAWTPARIEAAVRGLAELHAVWFDRSAALPWLGPVLSAANVAEMSDLWAALADHAAGFFAPWLGPDVRPLQRRLLDTLDRWWRPLEQMPHTLIHNDFNPRNIALRTGPVLCAYDWELATSAVPQHDLAQFLCFVLPADGPAEAAEHYLRLHRTALEAASGRRIAADDWRRGFGLALADLLVNRWAMYALVHAVRRQPFLERVLRTWRTLFAYYDPGAG